MRSRHDLVWLSPAGWTQALAAANRHGAADVDLASALAHWRDRNWPLVVRRQEAATPAGQLALGVPLPPAADGGKLRFACSVDQQLVAHWQAPLALADALAAAPAHWQALLQAFLLDCSRAAAALPRRGGEVPLRSLQPRVFGSLAMQAITGQPYLRAGSDLDVLMRPGCPAELDAALLLLRRHGEVLPLDGEIVFPGERAVAWRELDDAAAGTRVLVKSAALVQLVTRAELVASLAPPC